MKADNSPVIVGCGQRKKWKSEKEFEANERLKGQKTKLCKIMTEGEFQQRLEGVITDLEKGKEPWSLGSRKSQVPRRNKETAVSKAAGVQVRRKLSKNIGFGNMEATDDLAESHFSKAVTAESRLQWLQEGMGSEEMGPLSIDVPMTDWEGGRGGGRRQLWEPRSMSQSTFPPLPHLRGQFTHAQGHK